MYRRDLQGVVVEFLFAFACVAVGVGFGVYWFLFLQTKTVEEPKAPPALSVRKPEVVFPPYTPTPTYPLGVPASRTAALQTIVEHARTLALSHEPHAVLREINVPEVSPQGTIDIIAEPSLTIVFSYSYLDATKKVGADRVQGELKFFIRANGCNGPSPCFAIHYSDHSFLMNSDGAPIPSCSLPRALDVAKKSGIPDGALISAMYIANLDSPASWLFRVNGHPELSRSVDGSTCKLQQ